MPAKASRKRASRAARSMSAALGPRFRARVCTHVLLAAILSRALAPLRPLAGGEGGARRGSGGRVRWAVPPLRPRGLPHLTPTLSAPKGGEGDFGCQMCACPSAKAGDPTLLAD